MQMPKLININFNLLVATKLLYYDILSCNNLE